MAALVWPQEPSFAELHYSQLLDRSLKYHVQHVQPALWEWTVNLQWVWWHFLVPWIFPYGRSGTGLHWQVHKGQRGREHTDWKSCFWSKCGAFSPKWEKLWPVLKGLQLLKEALARLQWVTYFSEDDHAVKCKDLLDSLELLKHEVAKKSQHSLLYRQTCQG